METQLPLSEKFEKLFLIQENRQRPKRSKLADLMEKLSEKGLLQRDEYSLPLVDTIGRTLHDQKKLGRLSCPLLP